VEPFPGTFSRRPPPSAKDPSPACGPKPQPFTLPGWPSGGRRPGLLRQPPSPQGRGKKSSRALARPTPLLPSPRGEGGPRHALSPAGAGRGHHVLLVVGVRGLVPRPYPGTVKLQLPPRQSRGISQRISADWRTNSATICRQMTFPLARSRGTRLIVPSQPAGLSPLLLAIRGLSTMPCEDPAPAGAILPNEAGKEMRCAARGQFSHPRRDTLSRISYRQCQVRR